MVLPISYYINFKASFIFYGTVSLGFNCIAHTRYFDKSVLERSRRQRRQGDMPRNRVNNKEGDREKEGIKKGWAW